MKMNAWIKRGKAGRCGKRFSAQKNAYIKLSAQLTLICVLYSGAALSDIPDANGYMISAGGAHTCILDDNGVSCWGSDYDGQSLVPVTPSFSLHSPSYSLDIKVNGSDGLLIIPPNLFGNVNVTINLSPVDQAGQPADWWVSAHTPFGTYWLEEGVGWTLSDTPLPAYKGPQTRIPTLSVLQTLLPPGSYTFSFAVDDNQDGIMDAHHQDAVGVSIR